MDQQVNKQTDVSSQASLSRWLRQRSYTRWCWSDTRHSRTSGPRGRCRWGRRRPGSWAASRRPYASRCRCKPAGRTPRRGGPRPASANTHGTRHPLRSPASGGRGHGVCGRVRPLGAEWMRCGKRSAFTRVDKVLPVSNKAPLSSQ